MNNFYDLFNRPETPPGGTTVTPAGYTGTPHPYAVGALTGEAQRLATTPNGSRNHQLNAAAVKVGHYVGAGHIARADVETALTAAAHTCGLEPREIRATLNSGLTKGISEPRDPPPPTLTPVLTATVLSDTVQRDGDTTLADTVHDRLPLLDWHELWADDTEEEWIIEPILPARRLIALYSAPKVGKSLLMLEMAVAIARGTTVLGYTPHHPRRVLYVDFENDPRGDIRERLQAMGNTPDQLGNLCYLSYPTLAHLDTENGSLELLAAVTVYNCEVIIIDTVSRAVGGDENENDTWLNFYRHTGLKLKQAEKALIRLDHSGKDEMKGQRGGSAKVGDVDAVWRMSKITDTTFRLDCEANRMPVSEKTLVIHREVAPRLRHRVDAEGRYAAWKAKVQAVVDALDACGLPADASNRGSRETLRAASIRAENKVITEAVKRRRARLGLVITDDDTEDD